MVGISGRDVLFDVCVTQFAGSASHRLTCVQQKKMALFPFLAALWILELCDWHTVVVVTRLSHTTRLELEPLVLAWLKQLVRIAAGQLGHAEVRVHPTSLFENLWKLWRRGVVVLETRLMAAATNYGGVFWQLETSLARMWPPRGHLVAEAEKVEVLADSPLAGSRTLVAAWGLDVHWMRVRCQVRHGYILMDSWELTGFIFGFPVYAELRRHRLFPPAPPRTPVVVDVDNDADSDGDELWDTA